MYRLIYVSTARPEVGEAEVEDILVDARARNYHAGITGLLIHDGNRFLQYLEGEEDAVEDAFERIAGDDRHHAIVVLTRGPVESRQFPDWDMACKSTDGGISLTEAVAQMVRSCDDHIAAELVGFAEARERAA
jgi:hypothetical protein